MYKTIDIDTGRRARRTGTDWPITIRFTPHPDGRWTLTLDACRGDSSLATRSTHRSLKHAIFACWPSDTIEEALRWCEGLSCDGARELRAALELRAATKDS